MNIERITVNNFRNFGENVSFRLNTQLTTIIGINGKGKSSLLNALKIAAGTYLLGIPDASKRHIEESEIRRLDHGTHLSKITPTSVKAEGSIDGKALKAPWQRQIPEGRTKTTAYVEDIGEIREIALAKYTISQMGEVNIDNPVIAFFGTARLYGSSKNTLGPYVGRDIFKLGYYHWSNMELSSYNYANWLKGHRFVLEDRDDADNLYNAFMQCIKTSNPYIKDVGFDGEELRVKVVMQEDEPETPFLPLSLHSDGIRTHTAMVAELTYRCIMLNAHLGKQVTQKSRGIVIIDEIDLHIHPIWQRHILKDLKNAFPLIQFIVTTHSPLIVQSLESNELVNLDVVTDLAPNELSLDEISTHLMQVDSEYSEENFEKYETAKSLLSKLYDDSVPKNKLDKEIKKVADPGLRAFLELNKIVKGK